MLLNISCYFSVKHCQYIILKQCKIKYWKQFEAIWNSALLHRSYHSVLSYPHFTSHGFSYPRSTLVLVVMKLLYNCCWDNIPHSSVSKESACNAGDPGSIPGLGRSPAEGNGNPLQYSCLENPMDRGAWQAIVHGVTRVRHDLATKPPSTLVWKY